MNSLSFREIKAWSELREIVLLPWQLDALIALDLKRRSLGTDKPKDVVSDQPLSSDLFDALFAGRVK